MHWTIKKIINKYLNEDVIYYAFIKVINVLVWVTLIKISSSILNPTNLGNFFIFFTFASIFAIILTGWQSSSSLRFYHDSSNKYELVKTLLNSIIYNYKILLFNL